MSKIRVGIVNYLNTQPFMYGLKPFASGDVLELVPAYPAEVARLLRDNTIDLGLIPVAAMPGIASAKIIGQHCIACDGAVASVCLLSKVPLEEVTSILLDYQSRTSAALIKILMHHHWKRQVEWIDTQEEFVEQINGSVAGLLIGDRCLANRNHFPYVYDLGEAWKAMTGLPFVFAAWVANKELSPTFIDTFNNAMQYGIDQLEDVVKGNPFNYYDSFTYFHKNIQYTLDEAKLLGLNRFLSYL